MRLSMEMGLSRSNLEQITELAQLDPVDMKEQQL